MLSVLPNYDNMWHDETFPMIALPDKKVSLITRLEIQFQMVESAWTFDGRGARVTGRSNERSLGPPVRIGILHIHKYLERDFSIFRLIQRIAHGRQPLRILESHIISLLRPVSISTN